MPTWDVSTACKFIIGARLLWLWLPIMCCHQVQSVQLAGNVQQCVVGNECKIAHVWAECSLKLSCVLWNWSTGSLDNTDFTMWPSSKKSWGITGGIRYGVGMGGQSSMRDLPTSFQHIWTCVNVAHVPFPFRIQDLVSLYLASFPNLSHEWLAVWNPLRLKVSLLTEWSQLLSNWHFLVLSSLYCLSQAGLKLFPVFISFYSSIHSVVFMMIPL